MSKSERMLSMCLWAASWPRSNRAISPPVIRFHRHGLPGRIARPCENNLSRRREGSGGRHYRGEDDFLSIDGRIQAGSERCGSGGLGDLEDGSAALGGDANARYDSTRGCLSVQIALRVLNYAKGRKPAGAVSEAVENGFLAGGVQLKHRTVSVRSPAPSCPVQVALRVHDETAEGIPPITASREAVENGLVV